jgi:hypothetical protein
VLLSLLPPVATATVVWILVTVAGWTSVAGFVLALLAVGKQADMVTLGETCEHPANARNERLGWLVRDVHAVLGVERVAVVLYAPAAPGTGVVEACLGRPELVGARVRVSGGFGWGPGPESRLLVDGTGGWSVVSVPIGDPAGIVGVVAVATQRTRGLKPSDVELLEQLSRRATPLADGGADPERRRNPAAGRHAM